MWREREAVFATTIYSAMQKSGVRGELPAYHKKSARRCLRNIFYAAARSPCNP